jgi:hypothetical protein
MALHRIPALAGLLLALFLAFPVEGQVPMSARAVGVSGAMVGTARGLDALFINPANLALPGSPRLSVGLPQATLTGTVAGPAPGDLAELFRGDLPDSEKDRIFGTVPAAGMDARLDARVPVVGIQTGPFAVGVAYGAVGEQRVSRDVVELALFGYQQGRIDYRVEGTEGSRMTFWDVAVGYGQRFGPLSLGVTAHYLRGGTVTRTWVTEPRFDLIGYDIDAELVSVFVRGGHGFALDVGAAFQPRPTVTLSAAIANVMGGLTWSDELYIRTFRINRESLEDDPADVLDRHRTSERPAGPGDEAVLRGVTAGALHDQATLPTTTRLGLGWQPLPGTSLGLSYYGAATGGRMAGSWDSLLGVGIEQRIPLLAVRAGFASDLGGGTLLSGGLTLGPLELGVARVQDGELDATSRSGWIGAAGLTFRAGPTSR